MSCESPSSLVLINKETLPQIKRQLRECILLMEYLKPLLDAFVIDFFSENHLKTIQVVPECVKNHLLFHTTPEEMARLIDINELSNNGNRVRPLWLICLRSLVMRLALKRQPVSGPRQIVEGLKANLDKCHQKGKDKTDKTFEKETFDENDNWSSFESEFEQGVQHKKLHHVFRKHVKPKKQHEIVRMASLASKLHQSIDNYPKSDDNEVINKDNESSNDPNNGSGKGVIVDVGGGRGHLARLLAYRHNFQVLCVDTNEDFVSTGPALDEDLRKGLDKKRNKDNNESDIRNACKVHHLSLTLEPGKTSVIEKSVCNLKSDNTHFGLVALHACGDLGATAIHFFAMSTKAQYLLIASCCYMRSSQLLPMSHYLKSIMTREVSYGALELACHALETYVERLRAKEESKQLAIHCYRALLEHLLRGKNEGLRHAKLDKVDFKRVRHFHEYVEKATRSLRERGLVKFDKEQLDNNEVQEKIRDWWHVVAFYSLRLMLAPVVESVVLLDRALFLHEKLGLSAAVVPIFQPKISPRCQLIVAKKEP